MSELPEMVKALLDPKIYPDVTSKVELMQTQMSFVFLTGDYVYKVKKPVDLGYLDYTTLEKRHFYCQREVELNRRLCPCAYLGVVSITEEDHNFSINGEGKAIEYAVKMRHLPQERMLNIMLTKGRVSAEMMTDVAKKVAEFHRKAETNATISKYGDLGAIITNTEENFNQTIKYIGNTISQKSYRHIKDYTNSYIEKNVSLFYERIADSKIRDCHGDLHTAHVCFTDDICIYDCIEFNDRFRYCDVASEISFLAMDLDRYDRADLSQVFVDAYLAFSGDKGLTKLLNYYKCYLAYVRGKVESFKFDDPHVSEEERAGTLVAARKYFELAESYI